MAESYRQRDQSVWEILTLAHSSEGFRIVEARRIHAEDLLPQTAECAP